MARITMWLEECGDGSFKVVHRKLGVLAHAGDWKSARLFYDNWNKIHIVTDKDIVEDKDAFTQGRPI